MSGEPPHKGSQSPSHLGFLKKLTRFKPSLELSSHGALAIFFFSLCVIFCFVLLDYSTVTGNVRPTLLFTWVGLNDSSASSLPQVGNGKVGFLEKGGGGCNIFEGDWVWDESYPLYRSEDCKFSDEGFRCSENGRPDHFYTKWRWQPKDCNLPRFNAKLMLENLRNRRLAFVGDSIGRNQWESLLCMLSSAVSDRSSIYELNGRPITKHTGSLIFKFNDFNCSIEYYRAPFIVLQSRAPAGAPEKVKMTLKLDQMDWSSSQWKGADVLVFNSGHWWNSEKTIKWGCYFQEGAEVKMDMTVETAFKKSIETVIDWINHEIDMTRTLVFFRSYSPVHFRGGDWNTGGSCHQETLPDLQAPVSSETSNEIKMTVLDELLKKSQLPNLQKLNVTSMSYWRKDGHPSLYYLGPKEGPAPLHRQDCSHWCLPGVPDSWNELLYAVFLQGYLRGAQNSISPSQSRVENDM